MAIDQFKQMNDNFTPEKYLLEAYRKAKVDLYYDGNTRLFKILEYEEDLGSNLIKLHNKLIQKNNDWIKQKNLLGEWYLLPSSIDIKNIKPTFINADPLKAWQNICETKKPIAEFRILASPSIDFHVIASLWISKVGHLFDAKLLNCSYGNRLNRDKAGNITESPKGHFQNYLRPFRSWRENGLKAMRSALENGKPIVVMTTDITSFYHELTPDFLLDDSFLKKLKLTILDEIESNEISNMEITKLFIKAINLWSQSTPLKKGLPVGLPAASIIANMALHELDVAIQEELKPIYYGRYVDDIFLVLENNSNFGNTNDIWDWIVKRLPGLLKSVGKNAKRTIKYSPSYLKNSKIIFSNLKTKSFMLEGENGITFMSSFENEMLRKSSEWRAIPNLPEDPIEITNEVLTCTRESEAILETLRDADNVSMKMATFAIKLKELETYEKDLPPIAWKIQRYAFVKAYDKYALALPNFFNYYKYLSRIVCLITACEDFELLNSIFKKVQIILDLIKSNCIIKIKSIERILDFNIDEDLKTYQLKTINTFNDIFQENILRSLPLNLSGNGQMIWEKLRNENDSMPFFQNINEAQKLTVRFFNHDLGYIPFKFMLFPLEFVDFKKLIEKEKIKYIYFEIMTIITAPYWDHPRSFKICEQTNIDTEGSKKLPYGVYFAIRTLSLIDFQLIESSKEMNSSLKEYLKNIQRIREVESPLPEYSKNDIYNVPRTGTNKNFKIAICSWKTSIESYNASVKCEIDPDFTRYQRITLLMNSIIQNPIRPNYIIMPELSIPYKWFISFALKLQNYGISLIGGVEYIHNAKKKKIVHNQVWMALVHDCLGQPTFTLYRQDKQTPAQIEARTLEDLDNKKMKPQWDKWQNNMPPIIRHGEFHFAALLCSEFTNIAYRYALRGKVDALFVLEKNKDIGSFNALVESSSLDIHAYIIQCNDRQFGDSRIRSPHKDSWNRDIIKIKGGENDHFVIGEIDVQALRKFQSNYRSPSEPFKPTPDGFKIDQSRKSLPTGNS